MKYSVLFFLFLGSTLTLSAQEEVDSLTIKYAEKVATLDSTLTTLYQVISGEKEEERDWQLFKYLFHPDAKLIPSGKNKEGDYLVRYLSPQQYIDFSGQWLVDNGFYEKEISRKTDTFGNITQVFSTHESFYSKTDEKPFMRGINSIQLLYDGKRWWVINIYWTQETPENPIPEKYSD
ncbi:MAG: hypothetical protein KDD18_12960 [Mangrovimonas sp.]|nr:hypothetical protein [Mangrovimonas sp.]